MVFGSTAAPVLLAACSGDDASATGADAAADTSPEPVLGDSATPLADATADASETSCTMTATPFDAGLLFDGGDGAVDLSCVYHMSCGLTPGIVTVGCHAYYGLLDASPDAYIDIGCDFEGPACVDGAIVPEPNGALDMTCRDCFGGGRRPRGARPARLRATSTAGAYLAKMAHEEAASVLAFERIEEELTRFGAPRALRDAARRARGDETRHANVVAKAARRRGAACRAPTTRTWRTRSIEAFALENAVEGCVNETFGAFFLLGQASRASDGTLRRDLRRIARDELRHAALAWVIAAWLDDVLDAAARDRVAAARSRAMQAFARRLDVADDPALRLDLGLPDREESAQIVRRAIASFA